VCYWPDDKVHQHGDLFIELVSAPTKYPAYVTRELAITNTKINESRTGERLRYHRPHRTAAEDAEQVWGRSHRRARQVGLKGVARLWKRGRDLAGFFDGLLFSRTKRLFFFFLFFFFLFSCCCCS